MIEPAVSDKRHRFPAQIIAHAVWLYYNRRTPGHNDAGRGANRRRGQWPVLID
ncbi:hypothetical protein [Rhizobium sp. BK068]|uniref:hypothetical protein n=1 Tax=Rhizobium sp. BK068 TaxID=2512130 RepID=UPI001A9EE80E|nr:hypothetical protein [Rhizobium sp. BK068]